MSRLVVGINDLKTVNPQLITEWNNSKNGELRPEGFTTGSHTKVWWICLKGHEWVASIHSRNGGTGCPVCSGKVIKKGFNDLTTTNFGLSLEWHPTKNGDLTPQDVSSGSNKKVWWLGSCGHEWVASIKSRSNGRGCPVCTSKSICAGENDLFTTHYNLVKNEWDFRKNSSVSPNDLFANSHVPVWWKCKKGHSWKATPNHRISKGRNCPYCCHNPQLLRGSNDLATAIPDLAKEWHPTKNGELTPFDVTSKSSRRIWWLCDFGHEWKTSVEHRANGSSCPQCSRYMHSSFPEQAIYYYIKKYYPQAINGYTDIFPHRKMELDIFVPSLRIGIEYDGIAFHSSAIQRNREEKKYLICKKNGIALVRIREDKKNDDSRQSDYLLFTKESLNDTIIQLTDLFPLLDDIDIARDYSIIVAQYRLNLKSRSLSHLFPDIAAEWDYVKNDPLKPEMFSAHSNYKAWWRCKEDHSWKTTIDTRTAETNGRQCPYCSNNKVLKGYNDLATKRPDLLSEWDLDKNGTLSPESVTPGSGKKAWWICKKCRYSWLAEISSRNKGAGCPNCARMRTKEFSTYKKK